MKKIRTSLLSVLLFAFSFFVIHDYVITEIDADTQYELCYVDVDKTVIDLPSQIHDHIHILSASPEITQQMLHTFKVSTVPLVSLSTLYATIHPTPHRPPLS